MRNIINSIWYWIQRWDWLTIGLGGIMIIAIGMLAFCLSAFIVQGMKVAISLGGGG